MFDGIEKEFLFSNKQMKYPEAKSFCVNLDAKLFEPRSKSITCNVIDQAKRELIGDFWLGIHDKASEGNFVYDSDNQPIDWSDWAEGEPNNLGYGENCAVVDKNGEWVDLPCNWSPWKRSIVCERDTQDKYTV